MYNNLSDLLRDKSEKLHNKTFLYYEDSEISFRDLHEISSKFAKGLQKLGLKRDDKISILLPNLPEFIYAFFGIVKLGAVEVPINAMLKAQEVAYIVQNSESKALITVPAFRPLLSHVKKEAPNLEYIIMVGERENDEISFTDLLDNEAIEDLDIKGEDPAGIIYTSGTTGHPKGVVLTHKNYLTNAGQLKEAAGIDERDRFCCILPLFHVNAQLVTMLGPLYGGASMILLPKFSPPTFLSDLSRYRATAFSGVPTVYAILNSLPDSDKYDLSSLRFCICGAAPMPVPVFSTFEKKYKAFILEGYGLSEATCASSVNPLNGTRKIGSIGIPLPGQSMKIVDNAGNELGVNEIGEIIIKGDVVMKEYYKNDRATQEAIKDGWLYTGDLGYKDEDGYFYISGRKKEMIIRGGENIYPKEVEEVLYKYDGIAEAAIVGIPDPKWGEEVYGFVVPKEGVTINEDKILSFLKERLADYKCPKKIYFRTSLPKTATGKIKKLEIAKEFSSIVTEV